MHIETPYEYQQALREADSLFSKPGATLTTDEKEKLKTIVKAIEAYQFRTDPLPVVATIP